MGVGLGSVVFINLNSVAFCNKYIFSTPHEEPLLTLKEVLLGWIAIMVSLLAFVAFCKKEKKVQELEEVEGSEEPELSLKKVPHIMWDMLKRKHVILFFGFKFIMLAF